MFPLISLSKKGRTGKGLSEGGREEDVGNSSLLNRTRPFGRWPSLTDPAGIPSYRGITGDQTPPIPSHSSHPHFAKAAHYRQGID